MFKIETKGSVKFVYIDNATKKNAFNEKMWIELKNIMDDINNVPDIKCVVLLGSAEGFCSGIDIDEFKNLSDVINDDKEDVMSISNMLYNNIKIFQSCISSIEKCQKVVIAAMHGYVIGLGVDIASACDIRYGTKDCKFSIKEIDFGFAADIGTLQRFPKAIGNESIARELAFSGRIFDGNEAKSMGFLSEAFNSYQEMLAHSIKISKMISTKTSTGLTSTKSIILNARDNNTNESLELTSRLNSIALQSKEVKDHINKALSKL